MSLTSCGTRIVTACASQPAACLLKDGTNRHVPTGCSPKYRVAMARFTVVCMRSYGDDKNVLMIPSTNPFISPKLFPAVTIATSGP